MPKIVFISADGDRHEVEATTGQSIMRAAVTNDIDGIVAECGGAAACATCHVFVAPHPAVPPRSSLEDDMLDVTAVPRTDESRLSCQIFVTPAMDGLEVRMPETQL